MVEKFGLPKDVCSTAPFTKAQYENIFYTAIAKTGEKLTINDALELVQHVEKIAFMHAAVVLKMRLKTATNMIFASVDTSADGSVSKQECEAMEKKLPSDIKTRYRA